MTGPRDRSRTGRECRSPDGTRAAGRDTGAVRVAVDSTYPLAGARRAHERAARGHIRGKIVLTVA
ncbi:zinc-binding dehydrogenase [Methylobacterium variabile]|uniref:zinc-binding dehydrogenase n=1 Tax=Methylobacterium variabile TaxID=298794 RepID=UPI003CC91911